jgi:hypothetical protein
MGAAIVSPIPVRSVPYCSGSRVSANRFRPISHHTSATESLLSATLFALAQREEMAPGSTLRDQRAAERTVQASTQDMVVESGVKIRA